MARIIGITDLSQPELQVYTRLTDAQLRNRLEPGKGVFIAQSAGVIRLALDAGYEPVSLLMEDRQLSGPAGELIARCGGIPVYTAGRSVLAGLTGYPLTRGVLCAMRRPRLPDAEELCAGLRRVAVLEDVVDSTNVGALFRSAAALGMDAVLVTPSCCDPLCRRAVRVSMGTVFQIPWTRIGASPSEWPQPGIDRLKNLGFRLAAMALDDRAIPVDDPRPAAEDRLAVLLGNEGSGLSPRTIEACDYLVRIPMAHGVDSLNVAAAGAVVFWALRARDAG